MGLAIAKHLFNPCFKLAIQHYLSLLKNACPEYLSIIKENPILAEFSEIGLLNNIAVFQLNGRTIIENQCIIWKNYILPHLLQIKDLDDIIYKYFLTDPEEKYMNIFLESFFTVDFINALESFPKALMLEPNYYQKCLLLNYLNWDKIVPVIEWLDSKNRLVMLVYLDWCFFAGKLITIIPSSILCLVEELCEVDKQSESPDVELKEYDLLGKIINMDFSFVDVGFIINLINWLNECFTNRNILNLLRNCFDGEVIYNFLTFSAYCTMDESLNLYICQAKSVVLRYVTKSENRLFLCKVLDRLSCLIAKHSFQLEKFKFNDLLSFKYYLANKVDENSVKHFIKS